MLLNINISFEEYYIFINCYYYYYIKFLNLLINLKNSNFIIKILFLFIKFIELNFNNIYIFLCYKFNLEH